MPASCLTGGDASIFRRTVFRDYLRGSYDIASALLIPVGDCVCNVVPLSILLLKRFSTALSDRKYFSLHSLSKMSDKEHALPVLGNPVVL
jgi:hypothetical protein